MSLSDYTTSPPNHELKFEYSEITPDIFLGTNMCCQVHFDEELSKKGVTADISLEEERLDAPFGVESFLWLPTKDDRPPNPSQLQVGVDTIASLIKNGEKVYVHCKFGHGRSPTLVAAYLISQGKSVEDALSIIKEQRPSIHLDPSQIKALEAFQEQQR